MMSVPRLLVLATLLPLVSFGVMLLLGRRIRRTAGIVATALAFGSLALSLGGLVLWVEKPEFAQAHYLEVRSRAWLALPGAGVTGPEMRVSVLVDALTVSMFAAITFMAFVAHLFSIVFVPASDRRCLRYFGMLGLLCFSLLGLVLSNSLIQVLVFWGVAGVAGATLIGLRQEQRAVAGAWLKVVLAEQVGNMFFLAGVGIVVFHFGGLELPLYDSQGVAGVWGAMASPAEGGMHWLSWAGLCFVLAAASKAGQFPMHLWLGEAVHAPAPAGGLLVGCVSGAGVYLLARLYPMLTMDARVTMCMLGSVTAGCAGLMAMVQTDPRRIVAWTAVCQLGQMMLFLGAGAYVAGMVHFFSSAFAVVCLFLVVGAIVHGLGQGVAGADLRQLGGLGRKLPITAAAALLAGMALAGVPWFSGEYSRDGGLAQVYDFAKGRSAVSGEAWVMGVWFWIPALTTFLVTVAMGRFWWLTFAGRSRNERMTAGARESPVLTLSLILLVGLTLGPLLEFLELRNLIGRSVGAGMAREASPAAAAAVLMGTRWSLALGIAVVAAIYARGPAVAERLRRLPGVRLAHAWLMERMFLEAVYQAAALAVRGLAWSGGVLERVLGWGCGAGAWATRGVGRRLGRLEGRLPGIPPPEPS